MNQHSHQVPSSCFRSFSSASINNLTWSIGNLHDNNLTFGNCLIYSIVNILAFIFYLEHNKIVFAYQLTMIETPEGKVNFLMLSVYERKRVF